MIVLEWVITNLDTISSLGLIGALLGFGLREWFDRRRRVRERRGLLTMLDYETEQNEELLTTFERDPTLITEAAAHSFYRNLWEESRARLSHLLKKEEFADLLKYYEGLRVIDQARKDVSDAVTVSEFGTQQYRVAEKKMAVIQRSIAKGLPQLREQNDKAKGVIKTYVPKDALDGTPLKDITFDRFPPRENKRSS